MHGYTYNLAGYTYTVLMVYVLCCLQLEFQSFISYKIIVGRPTTKPCEILPCMHLMFLSHHFIAVYMYHIYTRTDIAVQHQIPEDENASNQTVAPPNCSLLFKGDQDEVNRVNKWKSELWTVTPNDQFYQQLNSCDRIRTKFEKGYYTSGEEKDFPLAFALNVHNSPQQIFMFLQVIYRPHNVYCIHYDQKSEESFKKVMRSIADCLPNVIIPSKTESVIRSWHTVVDAQMNCMSDLNKLRDRYPWRYVTTLCGKEVPLKTNREMVQVLKKLNGTSAVHLSLNLPHEKDYWKYKHILSDTGHAQQVTKTSEMLGPPPFNLTMKKSLAYYALSYAFVDFLLNDERVKVFRKFVEDTDIPEEHFVATLFNMKGDSVDMIIG